MVPLTENQSKAARYRAEDQSEKRTLKLGSNEDISLSELLNCVLLQYFNTSGFWPSYAPVFLKVHKIENFFGSDFEFCVISLLVILKY